MWNAAVLRELLAERTIWTYDPYVASSDLSHRCGYARLNQLTLSEDDCVGTVEFVLRCERFVDVTLRRGAGSVRIVSFVEQILFPAVCVLNTRNSSHSTTID